jgi:hypothetical protein
MQTASGGATPTFERGRGQGISTSAFGVLHENQMMIWEVGQSPFCCHPLGPAEKTHFLISTIVTRNTNKERKQRQMDEKSFSECEYEGQT